MAVDGLIVVDKPAGWTSHDVVGRARRLAGTRKVGHAGTLDPMATGVLVLGVGRATRMLGYLAASSKAYDATIRLGQTTVTDDAEGEPVQTVDASGVDESLLRKAVQGLTGDIEQVPSAVSAIKVDGQRSYRRVRAGKAVDIPARPVTVSHFTICAVRRLGALVDVDVHVECSTGTYVRALARDVGARLGVGGHLIALRRTRAGRYALADAHTLETLEQRLTMVPLDEAAATNFTTYTVVDDQAAGVRNGRTLTGNLGSPGPVAMLTSTGEFLALYDQHGPVAKAIAVFPSAT